MVWNEYPFILGDINIDSIIDILDIVFLVNIILGQDITGNQYYLSDINQDNTINIQDIILIINIVINNLWLLKQAKHQFW